MMMEMHEIFPLLHGVAIVGNVHAADSSASPKAVEEEEERTPNFCVLV